MTTGIIIPDMYMPDCCWDCPLYARLSKVAEIGWCYALCEEISFADARERYAGCKLIETEVDDGSD